MSKADSPPIEMHDKHCNICRQDRQIDTPAVVRAPVGGTMLFLCPDHRNESDNRLAESHLTERTDITGPPEREPESIEGTPTVIPQPTPDHDHTADCPACGAPRRVDPTAEYAVHCEACGQPFEIGRHWLYGGSR